MRVSRELAVLAKAFAAAGLRALALKGPALAARLGDDPDSRPAADLDVLVAEEDVDRAAAVLEAQGFCARPRSNGLIRQIHFVRAKPLLCVDLHWQVAPLQIRFPLDFDELWAERSEVVIHGVPVPVPSDVWQLLLTSLYCVREAPLVEHRYLADLVRLARLLPDSAWREVSQRATRLRVRRMVAATVRAACAASRTPLPAAFTEQFPEDDGVRTAVADLLARMHDPRRAHKRRFVTYFEHFFAHGRFREDWRDRIRPLLFFPLFLLLPEDDDVERAAISGRSPFVERLLRVKEVLMALRAAQREAKQERLFEARLADPQSRLAPAADVELHILDDRGLLFAPHAGELHALTTGATWIWCALEEGWTLGELVHDFAKTSRTSPTEARTAICDLLRLWWREGLLEGAPRSAAVTAAEATAAISEPCAPPRGAAVSSACERGPPPAAAVGIALLGSHYHVRISDAEAAARVLSLLRPWLASCGDGAAVPVDIVRRDAEWQVRIAGEAVATAFSLEELAPRLAAALRDDALTRHGYDLLLPAAMLARPEGALLLAAAGSDKSPLALVLAQLGFVYLGDEAVILAGEPLRAKAVPGCPTVEEEALQQLRPCDPMPARPPGLRRSDSHPGRDLPPEAAPALPPQATQSVRWLVFPDFREGAQTQLEPLDAVEALTRLFDLRLKLNRPLSRDLVRRLVDWIAPIEAFALEYGDPRDAAERLVQLTDMAPAR